ncbi:DEAD-box ATP-dependent RNA helicase 46 isoform X2 [Ziziphus jujuba]|uniref:RNA helicase n=1 Tax=Ziziphus jujuba TaxID=326968 RepID=A0ABM3IGT3_ZIZJJ|nr:DEAD-box ATP-dependent RNA helicase 46 isoform X2 [Ziziphus jujuba]
MAATAAAGPRYAPEDPTLPKPWRGLVDGKTGYLYFWNPETNVTQYERPMGLAPPLKSSLVPISSSVHAQQSARGQRHYHTPDERDVEYGKGGNGGSKLEVGTRSQQSARGGTAASHNAARGGAVSSLSAPNGTAFDGHGGSLARGHGTSDAGSVLSAESYRRRHEISVTVHNAGFSAPTPIQAQSWPVALQSRDIVAIAKTGSGKTLGYLIPGFIHLKRCHNDSQLGPTVLVLSPTRELATQIQDEAVKFGKSSRLSCVCLYGGAPKGPQLRDIDRGADIVVATPGRLNDILEMRRISLHQVSYLVLDEADRMLDMGFEPQIRKIVKEVPARRQTLMYTATWPKEVRKIAADLLVNPVQVNIGNVDELVANKAITQHVEVLAPLEKHRRLENILRSQEPGSKIIVFCSTKKMCDQLARNLTRQFGAAAIHGDKSQGERDYVLNQFRTGRTPVLVATDVAARGLDIKDIRVVINYDFPTGVEDYVHRIGRTGRAGATGVAYTFFGDQDAKYASDLVKVLEGANQRVPPEIRDMGSRGGGGGMGRFRRWSSGTGGRDGGRGGRNDSNYGGRGGWGSSSSSSSRPDKGGGRGYDSRDRFDQGYHNGYDADARGKYDRGRSRSPEKGSGLGDRSRNWNRERSRSRSLERFDRGPTVSFHKAMMERGRISPPPQRQHVPPGNPTNDRASSHSGGGEKANHGGSYDGHSQEWGRSSGDGPHSSYFGEEAEEGMIPQDEDGCN